MESDLDSSFRKTDDDDCSSSEYDEKPGRSEFVRKAKFKCTHPGCKEEFRREVALDKHVFKHTGIVSSPQPMSLINNSLLHCPFRKSTPARFRIVQNRIRTPRT